MYLCIFLLFTVTWPPFYPNTNQYLKQVTVITCNFFLSSLFSSLISTVSGSGTGPTQCPERSHRLHTTERQVPLRRVCNPQPETGTTDDGLRQAAGQKGRPEPPLCWGTRYWMKILIHLFEILRGTEGLQAHEWPCSAPGPSTSVTSIEGTATSPEGFSCYPE